MFCCLVMATLAGIIPMASRKIRNPRMWNLPYIHPVPIRHASLVAIAPDKRIPPLLSSISVKPKLFSSFLLLLPLHHQLYARLLCSCFCYCTVALFHGRLDILNYDARSFELRCGGRLGCCCQCSRLGPDSQISTGTF